MFGVHRPGNNEGTRLHTTPSKKTKDGLKGQINPPGSQTFVRTFSLNRSRVGIISSIAFCPDQTSEYFAAGTLTPSDFNIALFSEPTGEKTMMWVGCEELRNSVSQVITPLLSIARETTDPFQHPS